MKKILALVSVAVIAIGTWAFAAAPAINEWSAVFGPQTIDSAYTATTWNLIDSIIVIKTDTCYTVYTMSGQATLGPNDVLYLGIDDGGGKNGLPVDTVRVAGFPFDHAPRGGVSSVPFTMTYTDSLISQTDANDTIYFYMAVQDATTAREVAIRTVRLTAQVLDYNAAGVLGE